MRTVVLGRTDLRVSRVGMGGIPLTRPSESDAADLVRRASDLGVTFFDTARGYGESEKRLGMGLKGRRGEAVVATKGGRHARESIEESLRQLQTDYIDVWQFHGVNTQEILDLILTMGPYEEAQQALRDGKIRHLGLSSHTLDVAIKAVESGHFETVQFPLNLLYPDAVAKIVPKAEEHNVGLIAMKPFAGGRLTNANLAIRYLLQYDNVVPDPGIERPTEIEEIVAIVESEQWDLTAEDLGEIERIREDVGTIFCRRCGYCCPCPQGVNIVPLMNVDVLWGLWNPDWFFAFIEEPIKSFENCADCGACEEKCPYELPIRNMIRKNVALYRRLLEQKDVVP